MSPDTHEPADRWGPDPEPLRGRPGTPRDGGAGAPLPRSMSAAQGGSPMQVLVAGGGVAALELSLALEACAGRLVETTILAPEEYYVERAGRMREPFGLGGPGRLPLSRIAERAHASVVPGRLRRVDADGRRARTDDGQELRYDALVVAVGARMRPLLPQAVTFGLEAPAAMADLLLDVEEEYDAGLVVVVPPGPAWPLPAYELVLLAAAEARAMSRRFRIILVTPESQPLAVFGREASRETRRLLDAARVDLRCSSVAWQDESATVILAPSGERLGGMRAVTLPVLRGPVIGGLLGNDDGFLPVDGFGRVAGTTAVYAIGDAADWPIKHGSLAAQQAVTAARHIAQLAGADVAATPWSPVLEGTLLAGTSAVRLRARASAIGTHTELFDEHAAAPGHKVAAEHLSAVLEEAHRRS